MLEISSYSMPGREGRVRREIPSPQYLVNYYNSGVKNNVTFSDSHYDIIRVVAEKVYDDRGKKEAAKFLASFKNIDRSSILRMQYNYRGPSSDRETDLHNLFKNEWESRKDSGRRRNPFTIFMNKCLDAIPI